MKIMCKYRGMQCEVMHYRKTIPLMKIILPSGEVITVFKSSVTLNGWIDEDGGGILQ